MTTPLFDDRLAPITWGVGYLNVGLPEAADALASWLARMGRRVEREDLTGDLANSLVRLEPLIAGARPRELLVEVGSNWTAYFDCLLQGTDADSAIGSLTRRIGCAGIAIRYVVGSDSDALVRKPPARSFQLLGAAQTSWLNVVRSVACVHDGSRWTFEAAGTPQPFEDLSAYKSTRVGDRFTPGMLQAYCKSVTGIDLLDDSLYGPKAALFRSDAVLPPDPLVLSLADARKRFGLRAKHAV